MRVIEMRASPRIEVDMPAKIVVMSKGLRIKQILDCTVVNISEGGALISAHAPIEASEFYLEANNDKSTLHLCAVVWRATAFKVGVKFLQEAR